MAHTCHAAGCGKHVTPQMLMCKRHWFTVPPDIRKKVLQAYREGQCDDWTIMHAYAEAARDAVKAVAVIENRTTKEIMEALAVYDMLDPGEDK